MSGVWGGGSWRPFRLTHQAARTPAPPTAHPKQPPPDAQPERCDAAQVFEEHGEVEEVFIMRGGSRSGMVGRLGAHPSQ